MSRFIARVAFGILSFSGMTAGFQASPADKKPGAMQMSEKEFVTMMLQHHQDGIEMARIAEQKATTADVKSLAKKIREGHPREAQEMKPFAEGTAATPQGTSGQQHQAHAAEHQAHMQESKNAIERVRKASGKAVDQAFLDEMAKHHQMAIQMTQQTKFETARLKQMADKMVANQTKEIDERKRTRQRVS
jgi:uncharacterized protein (DUF305 family)